MKRLRGKVAVITGASRGVGRAIAVAYAHEGAAVMGIDKAAEVSATAAYPVNGGGSTGCVTRSSNWLAWA